MAYIINKNNNNKSLKLINFTPHEFPRFYTMDHVLCTLLGLPPRLGHFKAVKVKPWSHGTPNQSPVTQ